MTFKLFPRKKESIDSAVSFLKRISSSELSQGIVLFLCVLGAMIWANSPCADLYEALRHTPIGMTIGTVGFEMSLLHWINDGLMVFFFFLVGLEIKKEMAVGELAKPKQALFPLLAACGGMMMPAILFLLVAQNEVMARGWAVPTATDIAFAVGILSFVSKKVPPAVKVFLMAVAVIDDIGGILIIGLFYSNFPDMLAIMTAFLILLFMFAMNRAGVRSGIWYTLLSILLWIAVLKSGIHATIAGVMAAMAIPVRPKIGIPDVMNKSKEILTALERKNHFTVPLLADDETASAVSKLRYQFSQALTPLHHSEKAMHTFVSFVVLPIFALANAGVAVSQSGKELFTQPVTLAVALGLVIGKPLGIFTASYLSVKAGLAHKPNSAGWKHIFGAGCLGGIGFTMALFIATLAFNDVQLLDSAKIGILTGSFVSAIIGLTVLVRTGK